MPDASAADSDQVEVKPESTLENFNVSEKTSETSSQNQAATAGVAIDNQPAPAKQDEPKGEPQVSEEKPEEGSKDQSDNKDDLKPKTVAHTSSLTQTETDSLETEQVVVFKLENEEYAAPILDVQEIIPTGEITPFPNVPDYISGIINVRGTVATVIDPAKKFNLSRKSEEGIDRYIILTTVGKALFGITVDEVTSVMKIPTNKIKSATSMNESKIDKEYVNKVAVIDDRVILILDFKKILDEEAIASFSGAEAKS